MQRRSTGHAAGRDVPGSQVRSGVWRGRGIILYEYTGAVYHGVGYDSLINDQGEAETLGVLARAGEGGG